MPVKVSDEVAAQLEALGIRRGNYALEPLNRIQKLIAARLTEAARDIPTFPLTVDFVIDALLARRTEFNRSNGTRVSVNDLMVKASAFALKEIPAVNSSFTPLGLVRHGQVDIAIAVATDSGLFTPIIFAADDKNIVQIATAARDLSERARAGRLQSDEYIGGTFAISNLGMFGITSFASIINPPHSAILSIGAGRAGVVVADSGETRTATLMTVTLTCDHRVIDGATGARWLSALRRVVEQPNQLFE
jgi:pyruvate dehydrogenase E2 component (dihydrolipoyllysine-residue acetyltransferase)